MQGIRHSCPEFMVEYGRFRCFDAAEVAGWQQQVFSIEQITYQHA